MTSQVVSQISQIQNLMIHLGFTPQDAKWKSFGNSRDCLVGVNLSYLSSMIMISQLKVKGPQKSVGYPQINSCRAFFFPYQAYLDGTSTMTGICLSDADGKSLMFILSKVCVMVIYHTK